MNIPASTLKKMAIGATAVATTASIAYAVSKPAQPRTTQVEPAPTAEPTVTPSAAPEPTPFPVHPCLGCGMG